MVQRQGLSIFEKYLTAWVFLCICGGIFIGKFVPALAVKLDSFSVCNLSIPIAICLFFMMYPIMVKIDFGNVIKAAKAPKPVALTLFVNWAIKPFTMYLIASFFLGHIFKGFLPGSEILKTGEDVELYRSYISGCILLGIAPCTAMVIIWGYLAKGDDGLTLIMVAINSLSMLIFYAPLGNFLLGVNAMPIPWQTMLTSTAVYVALPLAAGYSTRRLIIRYKGEKWLNKRFLHWLTPISITALLATLTLLFSLKGDIIIGNPLTILWIAIPILTQTIFIFCIAYFIMARLLRLPYQDAAPAALIGASNHFEVAIATAAILFGLSSGASLATVVGVLIEVPLMLMLVSISKRTCFLFEECSLDMPQCRTNRLIRNRAVIQ